VNKEGRRGWEGGPVLNRLRSQGTAGTGEWKVRGKLLITGERGHRTIESVGARRGQDWKGALALNKTGKNTGYTSKKTFANPCV